jgi:uncharacterized caspase-like protein/invasion protein IalB
MRIRSAILLTLFVSLIACPAHAEKRVALVIGNAAYKNAATLQNPRNDANDIAAALTRLNFSVNKVMDGTFDDMRRALLQFGRDTVGADMAVIYYSGHGMEIGGENWLIPVDAELLSDSDAESEAIPLKSAMLQAAHGSSLGLVILDACRNNPFAAKMQRSARYRSVDRGLVRVEPTDNVLVAYAAREGTVAGDGDGRHSPFTTALLNNIETPGLEITFLFRNVRDEVLAATKREQQPFVYGSLSRQAIYLKEPPANVQDAAAPANQSVQTDAGQAWAATQATTSQAVLEEFIRQFGHTPYGSMARARLEELKKSQVVVATPSLQPPGPASSERQKPATPANSAPGTTSSPPPLKYSPWTKVCFLGGDGKRVCLTDLEARSETGYVLTNVQLIEPEGEPKKILRVTVPMPVALRYGTRVIIDQGPANPGVYQTCSTNWCISDFEATPDFIAKLKTGTVLQVQAINYQGQGFGFPIPLADFKKANEGPPSELNSLDVEGRKQFESLNLKPTAEQTVILNQGGTVFSPWMKFCVKTPDSSKQVCVTGREARSETGLSVANVQLIEPEGEPKKILRVTVPMPVELKYGTRVTIDQGPANPGVYQTCFTPNGCMSDFEATPNFIAKLKTGQTLQLQAIDYQGRGFDFQIPLVNFKKANEGPPSDPKALEEEQKKLQEALQKRNDQARRGAAQ